MSKLAKALTAAAGNAGESLYVEDVFSTYLYTGNSSTQTITNGIDLANQGGMTWFRLRNTSDYHNIFDSSRGITKFISSNTTSAQSTTSNAITSYNNNGFTLGADTGGQTNVSGYNYASWTFRKAEKFFDVVTYTGDGTANRQVPHNLGSVPGCIILKRYDTADDWKVYHVGADATAPEDYVLELNSTNARLDSISAWNDTAPTDSNFTVNSGGSYNASGGSYVAYLFAHDAGGFGDNGSENVISCGSFTTDGSGNATVNLGWEPQWFLRKRIDSTGNWTLVDNMRGFTADGIDAFLYPNLSNAEFTGGGSERLTSTGVNITGFGAAITFIYIAIRRPMKTPESGTEVFSPIAYSGANGAAQNISAGFPVDVDIIKIRNDGTREPLNHARLMGGVFLRTNSTAAQASFSDNIVSFSAGQNVIGLPATGGGTNEINGASTSNYIGWAFRRATGFFDVECHTGDGTANRTVAHNLGVVPELMILKSRSSTAGWPVYTEATSSAGFLLLNNTAAYQTGTYWGTSGGVAPTASQFTVNGSGNVSTYNYVVYLFATLAGVSKVGSYTGTGSNVDVDCGFSAGARFILIKRTDSTGDWYVWDSARGIVAGNDPYLLINSTAAEVTSTDYIDPLASGFTVTSSAPAALNASGGTYIFLAIA